VPKLTTPISVQPYVCASTASGPPLSPWHESVVLLGAPPAHSMVAVMVFGYGVPQSGLVQVSTGAYSRVDDVDPPDDVVPHPETVAVTPPASIAPPLARAMVSTTLLSVAGVLSLSSATSLSSDIEPSYSGCLITVLTLSCWPVSPALSWSSSPAKTVTCDGATVAPESSIQWAAVSTQFGSIRLPPQIEPDPPGVRSASMSRPTCQGTGHRSPAGR